MKRLNENVFNHYPTYFPVEKKLTYLIGENGSGKSELLKTLKKYYENEGNEVLYFSEFRQFELTDWELASFFWSHKTKEDSYLAKYKINYELSGRTIKQGMSVSSGIHQIINFFSQIETKKDVIVLIDEPERNIDINKQRWLTKDIVGLPNVKKLVVATHSPSLIEEGWDCCIDVSRCVNLYGELVYINGNHLPKLLLKANREWRKYIDYELNESENRLKWSYFLSDDSINFLNKLTFKSISMSKVSSEVEMDIDARYLGDVYQIRNNTLKTPSFMTKEEVGCMDDLFKNFDINSLIQTGYNLSLDYGNVLTINDYKGDY